MKDNAAYIEHCKKKIELADETIKAVEEARKKGWKGAPLDNVESNEKAVKQVYEAILEEESH